METGAADTSRAAAASSSSSSEHREQDSDMGQTSHKCPLDSRCGVCFDQMVYVVCRNLTDGVKMMMEAGAVSVDLLKSDCPEPPSDGGGDDGASKLLAIIIPILLLLLLIVVLLCVFWKRLLKFLKLGSQRPETEKSEQSVALKNGTSRRGSADIMFST